MRRRLLAKRARVLHLEPGDVVLLEVPGDLTHDRVHAIKAQWESRFPDVPVAVLGGMRAKVLRRADAATTTTRPERPPARPTTVDHGGRS